MVVKCSEQYLEHSGLLIDANGGGDIVLQVTSCPFVTTYRPCLTQKLLPLSPWRDTKNGCSLGMGRSLVRQNPEDSLIFRLSLPPS